MIARLEGTVVEKREGSVVIDVNGVGYLVHVSATCLASLPPG
ncbi:MAG: OB-fold domain-containing protein, partial [Deltaproteobacteria bacterium]